MTSLRPIWAHAGNISSVWWPFVTTPLRRIWRTPMPFPRWLARFNLRVTNHVLGPLATRLPGMGVVVHVGRKTHREYRTPVMIFRQDSRVTIALTYGPESQWIHN